MKATRHNGRSGKHGSYNPKHNDRQFDISHSEHIDGELALQNVYWDCYGGRRTSAETPENDESFEEVELRFYHDNYQDFVNGQNYRNECNGHSERNRSVEEIYRNKKTCPEESILQLGNIDGSASAETLMNVAETFFEQFNEQFGEHVHILDWALHVDEKTPHIHERHVFDALNVHGELAPQQDKALEALGIELPDPKKPKSKSNNRKMVFDAICRDMFLSICEEYGLAVDREPTYGGKKYLEKQDFIIENQKERLLKTNKALEEKQEQLSNVEVEISAVNTMMDCLVESAYETACDLIISPAAMYTYRTTAKFVEEGHEVSEFESGTPFGYHEKKAVKEVLNGIIGKFNKTTNRWIDILKDWFRKPERKEQNLEAMKVILWDKLENLSKTGPKDEEIHLDSEQEMTDHEVQEMQEQVAEKVQETATQMVKRRRGR